MAGKVTDEFYEKWRQAALLERPHQIPPSKSQFEVVLSILTDEDQKRILHQFDEATHD